MTVIRKDATIAPTGTDEDFPGTFEVILSAPTEDRDGETLLPEEWKTPLPDHITFDSDHGMSVATTVGSGVPTIDEETGNLRVSGTYSSLPRAQEVRTLVNEGHIRTTSVAFMTSKQGKGPGAKTVRELLNGAFVAVPSNREALVLSSKSHAAKAGARNSSKDQDLIQAAIEALIALGGIVPDAKAASRATSKSLVGSLEAVQDRARDALRDANPGAWVWLRGTLPNGDGTGLVVFEVEDPNTYDTDLWKQSYSDDGAVITLVGEPAAVDVQEVLTPDPDDDPASTSPDGADPTPAAGAPAPAAGVRSAPSGDRAAAQARELQLSRIRAMAAIARS